jgi:peptidoglycan/xylan/chitin deacetylase (PgdA/CDA1 family)
MITGGRHPRQSPRFARHLAVAIALVSLVFALPVAQGPSAAASSTAGQIQLVVGHSGKCLEVYGFSQANFATANQWGCWGGPNQQLQAVPVGGGYFELQFVHSGKCLDVLYWSTANGAPVGQWACHGGANQLWAGHFGSGDTYVIQNKYSGKCLDVYEARFGDGIPVIQWDCHFRANQLWRAEGMVAGATGLGVESQTCMADGKVMARFRWTPSENGVQWIDLSVQNNGFAGGYVGYGPLASDVGEFLWEELEPDTRHYLRVNTATPAGWRPSATVTFRTRDDCGTGGGPPAQVVRTLETTQKVVALTFDAGADAGYTDMILDILDDNDITAAFGITGVWAEEHPRLVERIADDGHLMINHSYDHSSFTGASTGGEPLTQAERSEQLSRTEDIITNLTGKSTKPYFRPPYGDYDASVNRDVGSQGYAFNVLWSLDSYGWRGIPSDEIVERVTSMVAPGAIIIMHVGSASQDGPALQEVIDELRAMGYTFASLDDYYP